MYSIISKKKLLMVMVAFAMSATLTAQNVNEQFSPEKFKADQEQFIVREACLTPQDAEKFFPLYDEMHNKARAVFDRMRNLGFVKPSTEAGCLNAIREHDKLDLELKKMDQYYHNRFLKILPASKVYDIIQAEDKFHRMMLKRFAKRQRPNP
jgi:hypothetical protein